jgi:hypothetical protein
MLAGINLLVLNMPNRHLSNTDFSRDFACPSSEFHPAIPGVEVDTIRCPNFN